ncbi:hypothetical protein LDDCCGHA_5299 [Methylobacterium oxalidis]|nr:hypothetical protein LDDCCGHA_5299 [Methylobacterium oxalidis]
MREKAPWIMLIVVLKSSLGVTAWSAWEILNLVG